MTLKSDAVFEVKMTLGFKNDVRSFSCEQWQIWKISLWCATFNEYVWSKKVQISYVSWDWRMMQNVGRNWLILWKMIWEIWQILTQLSKVWIFSLSWAPFDQSTQWLNCRKVMCNNTEEWYKVWRGTNLSFGKCHEEFCEFLPNIRKSQNLHFNGLHLIKVYNLWAKIL